MTGSGKKARRGGPLAMLLLLTAAWIGGRAAVWENPFPVDASDLLPTDLFAAESVTPPVGARSDEDLQVGQAPFVRVAIRNGRSSGAGVLGTANDKDLRFDVFRPGIDRIGSNAFMHQSLWQRALGSRYSDRSERAAILQSAPPGRIEGVTPVSPAVSRGAMSDRWSVDAWGFWREGSGATAISQGRVPVYGANQIGAILQFRARPSSTHDPRLYLRAYRAMVSRGESEIAAGVSAKPLGGMPLRVAAEMRVTDTRFGTNLRPAAYATTEIPPQQLPAGFRLEAYGQAGFVGGKGATAFADGQATVTRQVVSFNGPSESRANFSLGGGAWAGAQENAERVDVGPTVRLDLTIGEVPARVSVDWRERIGGDAQPGSGVAATLSTRF